MTPTPEQEAILAEGKSSDSLCIEADAGAAKTTTLCLLAKRLPLVPTLCCAFNKSIAIEMGKRMPSHITCQTMNSIGHRAWAAHVNKRLIVESDKVYSLTKELGDSLGATEKKPFNDAFSSIMRAVRAAKSSGYLPPKVAKLGTCFTELDDLLNGLAATLEVEPDDAFCAWMDTVLERSIAQAFEGRIDFDDQIYMPLCFSAAFQKYPIIMVDEAQDLSPMNHEMLRRMYGGRLIAVGDPKQAIYGFRGAHTNSMDLLKAEFEMKTMSLHVSFRCPQAIVERARWRAPDMQFPTWAKPGLVQHYDEWDAQTVENDSAVICRNNAPLFTTALRFIRAGRGVKLIGADIGASLVKVLKKFGDAKLPQEEVLAAIKEWEHGQLKKAREARVAAIRDRAECLRVFADFGKTLGESIAYAEHLFASSGSVQFMTGHKAKGLEFEVVYHLDAWLIPSKFAQRLAADGDESQLWQERNLKYVIETRSKDKLFFINSTDFI